MKTTTLSLILFLFISFSLKAQSDISTQSSSDDPMGKPKWVSYKDIEHFPTAPYATEIQKKQYVAVANIKDGKFVGKWREDWTAASIPWGHQELWTEDFKVISAGVWKNIPSNKMTSTGIKLPPLSLKCGNDAKKKTIYAARITTKKYGQQIGKYSPWIKMLAFSYGGDEIEIPVTVGGAYLNSEKAIVEILTDVQRID
jgi:hypothetical protein